MSDTSVLTINGVDLTPDTEWAMTWEERTDGSPGQFSATIQDRANSLQLGVAQRDHVRLTLQPSGFILYDGEIVNSTLDLPVGMPWGRWKISGSDWNTIPDLRLVGTPAGWLWFSYDGGLTFQTIDPHAQCGTSDASTVASLFANYVRRPYDGALFDTTAYVGTYISDTSEILFDDRTGVYHLDWTNSHTPLRSALDDVRSLGSRPIFVWIDPAGYVHWQAFQDVVLGSGSSLTPFIDGALTLGTPQTPDSLSGAAPAILTDSSPDGVTSIGCRALSFSFDASYMPQQVYVNGTTDYLYNGGDAIAQGTGWGHAAFGNGDPAMRQINVDAQSASVTDRLAVGSAYTHFNQRARIRISATFGGRLDEGPVIDGWRAGQTVTIIDARLPASLNGLAWPIQRVAGKLVAGQPTTRLYTIECGDMPIGRFYAKYRSAPKTIPTPRRPAYTYDIYFQNLAPDIGEVQTLVAQAKDSATKEVRVAGLPVEWTLVVKLAGVVTTSDATLTPTTGTTNADGQCAAAFTADSTTGGLTYVVTAATPPQ